MKMTTITTVETNVRLEESLIEYHINNMHHAEKCLSKNEKLTRHTSGESFENMHWCCEHSPAEGTIEISFLALPSSTIKHISVPVLTNFGVVCTKEKERDYKITWSYSLS
jgi:hypothetical protein